jgi:hypothetical protein
LSAAEDRGVRNLEAFCDLLARTIGELRNGSGGHRTLAARAEALEVLEGTAGPAAAQLTAQVESVGGELETAASDAHATTDEFRQAAQEIAASDLARAMEALDEMDAACRDARTRVQMGLEADSRVLIAEGHGQLGADAGGLAEQMEPLAHGSEAALRAASGELSALRDEAVAAEVDLGGALAQECSRVQDEVEELAQEADEATSAWSRDLADLARGCREMGTDLADFYDEWSAAAERETDSLLRELGDAGLELVDVLGSDAPLQLEGSMRAALGEPLSRLSDGLAQVDALITATASVAWELEGLVPQLAICMNVVENINRLLEEMG